MCSIQYLKLRRIDLQRLQRGAALADEYRGPEYRVPPLAICLAIHALEAAQRLSCCCSDRRVCSVGSRAAALTALIGRTTHAPASSHKHACFARAQASDGSLRGWGNSRCTMWGLVWWLRLHLRLSCSSPGRRCRAPMRRRGLRTPPLNACSNNGAAARCFAVLDEEHPSDITAARPGTVSA